MRDRDPKTGKFIKGNSMGGRNKLPTEVKEMLKAAAPEACQLLIDTVRDPGVDRKLRIRCAEAILDRVYGRPAQAVTLSNEGELERMAGVVLLPARGE